jgi:hypothetical protein
MAAITQIDNAKSKHFDLFKQIADLRGANFFAACVARAFFAFKDSRK